MKKREKILALGLIAAALGGAGYRYGSRVTASLLGGNTLVEEVVAKTAKGRGGHGGTGARGHGR